MFKRLIVRFTTVVVIFLPVYPFSPAVTRLVLHAQQVEPQTNSVDTLIQQGLSLLQQNRLEEALAKSAAATALNPNDWRPPVLAAYVYSAQQKMKSASESFAAAIRLAPQRKELYLAKAQADYFRNAHDEALAACKKAIEVDPNYAEAYLMVGDLLRFDDKRRAEAISALQTAIKINPKLNDAYDYLGEIFETVHDEKQAEEIFRKGMEADPKRMAGRFTLGRMMVKQGRLAEARQLWDGRTSDEDRTRPQFIEVLTRQKT
jgi:tetratricopeptide (TPR) repeat protein